MPGREGHALLPTSLPAEELQKLLPLDVEGYLMVPKQRTV
jgi:hypothetical protein